MPAVVVKAGPNAGRRVELDLEIVIGRQDGDLVLEDPEVSRRHAGLRRSGDSVVVEDLGSTNGTFVNGERIRTPIAVRPGDQIRVGRTTLQIEPDRRVDDTIVSIPLRPDQLRSAEARPSRDPVAEHEDTTQPLPSPIPESGPQPVGSNRRWLGLAAILLAGVVATIAYFGFVHRSAEDDFAASADDACAAVQRSEQGLDLTRTPTRGELQKALKVRLQALGAIRALERPQQDAALVGNFLSAFGETNASITRLDKAIGTGGRKVTRALRGLRGDARVERELAAKAGIAGCGGLAIG